MDAAFFQILTLGKENYTGKEKPPTLERCRRLARFVRPSRALSTASIFVGAGSIAAGTCCHNVLNGTPSARVRNK
jgi:hypothetical protein